MSGLVEGELPPVHIGGRTAGDGPANPAIQESPIEKVFLEKTVNRFGQYPDPAPGLALSDQFRCGQAAVSPLFGEELFP